MSNKNDVLHSARTEIGHQLGGDALHIEVQGVSIALCAAARHVERDGSAEVAARLLMKRRQRFTPNPSTLSAAVEKSEIRSLRAHVMRLVRTRTTDGRIDRTCQTKGHRDKGAVSMRAFRHGNPMRNIFPAI